MFKRIIFDILLVVLMIYLPVWLFAVMLIVGMFLFDYFWEGVFLAIVSNLVFGILGGDRVWLTIIFVLTPVLTLYGVELLKKKLKFYYK